MQTLTTLMMKDVHIAKGPPARRPKRKDTLKERFRLVVEFGKGRSKLTGYCL